MASTSAADAATASGSSENDSKTSDPGGGGGNNCSIGLNLRVTGYCNQGGRKYMEDVFSVAYQQVPTMYIRVFQNFWNTGNQSFLSTTFAPDRRETLRFAKKLRFLLWPGVQRRPGRGQFHWG